MCFKLNLILGTFINILCQISSSEDILLTTVISSNEVTEQVTTGKIDVEILEQWVSNLENVNTTGNTFNKTDFTEESTTNLVYEYPEYQDSYYYDLLPASEVILPSLSSFNSCIGETVVIRKCCDASQYMLDGASCEDGLTLSLIQNYTSKLLIEGLNSTITFKSGPTSCADGVNPNLVYEPHVWNFRISSCIGEIINVKTNTVVGTQKYCAEIAWYGENDFDFIIAHCPLEPPVSIPPNFVRKCCKSDEKYNSKYDCTTVNNENETFHLSENFLSSGVNTKNLFNRYEDFICHNGFFTEQEISKFIVNNEGHLCPKNKVQCYYQDDYCIENKDTQLNEVNVVALTCPDVGFIKCCKEGQVVKDHSCSNSTNTSRLMHQLVKQNLYKVNIHYNDLLNSLQDSTQWYIAKNGSLIVQLKSINYEHEIRRYCIDDVEINGELKPLAFPSMEEVINYIPVPIIKYPNAVPKCCKQEEFYEVINGSAQCIPKVYNESDVISDLGLNASEAIYAELLCTKLHSYLVYNNNDTYNLSSEEYATLKPDLTAVVYSLDGRCVDSSFIKAKHEYCLDSDGNGQYYIFVCSTPEEDKTNNGIVLYFSIVLILSSLSLLISIYFLLTTRVRSGLIFVNKINTLPGQNYFCYILATMIGFSTLSITNMADIKDGYTGCFFLGGISMFFLLAGFFWNTVICIDPLLLTIHGPFWKFSKKLFVLYSIGAWGLSAFITVTAMLVDYFRHDLPCSVVAPRFGRDTCFFSVKAPGAQLLYFYLPITVTVLVNIFCLTMARELRKRNLRSLGKTEHKKGSTGEEGTNDSRERKMNVFAAKNKPEKSSGGGLRTHHHQHHNRLKDIFRLTICSSILWLLEVLNFVLSSYTNQHDNLIYLWLIPSTLNALKGFCVFMVMLLTPENKLRIKNMLMPITSKKAIIFKHTKRSNKPFAIEKHYPTFKHRAYSLDQTQSRKTSFASLFTYVFSSTESRPSIGSDSVFGTYAIKENSLKKMSVISNGCERKSVIEVPKLSTSRAPTPILKISLHSFEAIDELSYTDESTLYTTEISSTSISSPL